jgi:hypothetical protein
MYVGRHPSPHHAGPIEGVQLDVTLMRRKWTSRPCEQSVHATLLAAQRVCVGRHEPVQADELLELLLPFPYDSLLRRIQLDTRRKEKLPTSILLLLHQLLERRIRHCLLSPYASSASLLSVRFEARARVYLCLAVWRHGVHPCLALPVQMKWVPRTSVCVCVCV